MSLENLYPEVTRTARTTADSKASGQMKVDMSKGARRKAVLSAIDKVVDKSKKTNKVGEKTVATMKRRPLPSNTGTITPPIYK